MASPPPPDASTPPTAADTVTPPPAPSTTKPPPAPPPFLPPDDQIRETLSKHQVYIQVALFVIFIFFATILILGRLRYRGGSKRKIAATKLFVITTYLVSYIPGLMSASDASSDIYLFWIAFVPYLAAVANEISCYTLGDNEERRKRLVIDYLIVWPLILKTLFNSLATPEVIVPVLIVFWVVILKLRERSSALLYATKSSDGLSRSTQIISDFFRFKKINPRHNNAPSYENFLVGFIEAHEMVIAPPKSSGVQPISESESTRNHVNDPSSNFITLDKIYNKEEPLAKSITNETKAKDLRDTCFSFTMFSLLLAKIGGYKNLDVKILGDGKVLDDHPADANLGGNNKLPGNCFELVDRELVFLYEYLFTNNYAIYDRGAGKKVRDVCVITLFFILTIPLLFEYRSQSHSLVYVILWHGVLDNGFTRFVIITILIIEFLQVLIFLSSNWAKVMYTCSYIGNQTSWPTLMPLKRFALRRLIGLAYWMPRPRLSKMWPWAFKKDKIGEYEILKSHCEIPHPVWVKCWVGSYVDLPDIGQAGGEKRTVKPGLTNWIIISINTFLQQSRGKITNGKVSLRNLKLATGDKDKCFTEGDTETSIVLIWHIATSLLEFEKIESGSKNEIDFKEIAQVLSKYNAYLVAFFPQLFTDQVYATRCEFNETVRELRKGIISEEQDDVEGRLLYDDSIVRQGRELKEELQKLGNNVWEILAEFWTERLFFLALSDHDAAIEAHIDRLCVGGEFITRLWALLTHAGCTQTDSVPSPTSIESQDNQTPVIPEDISRENI